MKIGFIGLGIMGSRMATNLQKHCCSLVMFNRTRAKAEPLLGPCGTFSDSPAKVADQVEILFTMLAKPDAVEEMALRANGFLNYLRPNAVWVDCSSVNPSFSKKMAAAAAARQIHFIDAPRDRVRSSRSGGKTCLLGWRRRGGFGNDSLAVALHGQQDCSRRGPRHGDFAENGHQSTNG